MMGFSLAGRYLPPLKPASQMTMAGQANPTIQDGKLKNSKCSPFSALCPICSSLNASLGRVEVPSSLAQS
jgi:hypothetical protein